jgi:heat shock protein HslJ
MMRSLSASLILLAAAGCATAPPPPVIVAKPEPPPAAPEPPAPPPPTIERAWTLAFIEGVSDPLPTSPTLTLKPDTLNGLNVEGFSGCGAFSGPAPLSGVSIRFGAMAAAQDPACTPAARALESKFLLTLGDTRKLTIRSGYLVLIDDIGKDRAYFRPQ